MKQKLPLAVAAVFAAALGFSLIAQSGDPIKKTQLERLPVEIPQSRAMSPNTASPDWRLLSSHVGLMLRHDQRGIAQARIYVRDGDGWRPVAIDGFSDIAPDDLFLQH